MSYDLTLFPPGEWADARQAWEELVRQQERDAADLDAWQKRPVPEPVRARMQQLADQLKSRRPQWQQFQPASPLPWIELNDEDLAVQVIISEQSVGITAAYFGDNAEEVMDVMGGTLRAIGDLTGYVAYDPQLGRTVTEADVGEMLATYRGVNQALPDMEHGRPRTGKKPWWKFWVRD